MSNPEITVGELCAEFLAALGVRAAFGVISIHNMPILDGFHTRGKIRFISARGEAGACNMADAAARVSGVLGVVVTSTGTGAGNAAGAMVEALTAGTPLLHLTGQIESPYLDRNLGFIHEAKDQIAMLQAVGKAAYRISKPDEALAILRSAVTLALTPPCGPVSIEIAIDVQKQILLRPFYPILDELSPILKIPATKEIDQLADAMLNAKRPLLWLGGGARGATAVVKKLIKLGFGIVTSVQGRGVVEESLTQNLGAFNVQKATQDLYAQADALLVVGSRLRSNETLSYRMALPAQRYRIDADPSIQEQKHPYDFVTTILADANQALLALSLALAERGVSEDKPLGNSSWVHQVADTKIAAKVQVDTGLAKYVLLKNAVEDVFTSLNQTEEKLPTWVRDITLSNTMWGNRNVCLVNPKQGVHALGGGIGQGLQMAIGAAISTGGMAFALCGDGGLMLNVGELACAVQEKAKVLLIVMNDSGYGVIKNIQDVDYGGRHAYVDLCTPNFALLCASMGIPHRRSSNPENVTNELKEAVSQLDTKNYQGPVMFEVDMKLWGTFAVKFAGPARK